jgi:hypothetical protein|tara:strand:+ start:179 stop:2113 length:1935 start_codon:yes stop_codon:yes gene_type:complete
MAIGETISYGINFDEGNERFLGGGQILLVETTIGYDLEFSFSITQKGPPFNTVAKMTSQEEDLGFGTSGFPDDIVNQYFEDIVFDIIDSPKFKGILFSSMIDKFSINFPTKPTPEPVPNNDEEEIPVYVVRSSIPTGGPRGQISFEFKERNGQRELGGLGEIFQDTYNTEEFSLPTVGESSTNFNYRSIGDSILQTMNDNIKNLPEGVEKLGVLSIVETQNEPPQNFYNYTLIGKVVDSATQEALENVTVEDDVKSVGLVGSIAYTEKTGDFKLEGEYQKGTTFKITFSLEGYKEKTINPFSREDNVLPADINIIELDTKEIDKETVIDSVAFDKDQVAVVAKASDLEDPFGSVQSKLLQKITQNLTLTLIPFILKLIKDNFGIGDPEAALGKRLEELNVVCPPNSDALNNLIKQKNKATKQLNNLYTRLENIKVAVETADKILSVANIVASTLSALVLALPTIPFAPPLAGPITTKIPQTPPKPPKSVLEIIADTLSLMNIISSSILLILTILLKKLKLVLDLMGLLDQLVQKCSVDIGGEGLIAQEQLSSDLLSSTQEQSNQGSPVVTNANGFDMSVIDVEDGTNNQLKRRQAIARNADGVIMLRGEPSFSSNDQILIDELVFFINMNNLKAGTSNETIINP